MESASNEADIVKLFSSLDYGVIPGAVIKYLLISAIRRLAVDDKSTRCGYTI